LLLFKILFHLFVSAVSTRAAFCEVARRFQICSTKSRHAQARTPGATARVAVGARWGWWTRCSSAPVGRERFCRRAAASHCIGAASDGVRVRASLHSTSETAPPRAGQHTAEKSRGARTTCFSGSRGR